METAQLAQSCLTKEETSPERSVLFCFFPFKVAELIKKKADSYLPILCPFHLLPNIKPPAAFARSWLV